MSKLKSLIITFVCLIVIIPALNAQTSDLSENDMQNIRDRVAQKIEEFQSGLSRMVSIDLSRSVRSNSYTNILCLFIGKGAPYDYFEYSLNDYVHSKGVKMQTSSVTTGRTTSQLLKRYLTKLYNPSTGRSEMIYSQIKIEKAAAIRVGEVYKEGDHYVCIATIYQDFYGIKDGRVVYSDRSGKRIRCMVSVLDIPDSGGQKLLDAKLGDIQVFETKRL